MTRYSVTATLGHTIIRRDFPYMSQAIIWRARLHAQGWQTSEVVAVNTAEPAPVAAFPRAV